MKFRLIMLVWICCCCAVPPGYAQSDPVGITDMAGRTLFIQRPVNKIVTTFKPASLCLLSLGLTDKWVGIDTPSAKDPLQKSVFPGVTDIAGVGSKSMGINLETITALDPDLVVLYSQKDGLALADRLTGLGIPCVIIIPETFESVKESLRVMATAAGAPERADLPIRQMDDVLETLARHLAALPASRRKTGYFSSPMGVFSTATGKMLQHQIMTAAGIDNVAAGLSGYFKEVSGEQLIAWQPQVMVLSQKIGEKGARRLESSAFKDIPAIRDKLVFRCPSALVPWDFPSPLSVLASLWLAKSVYPKRFERLDLQDRADRFHQVLFGKTLTQMGGSTLSTAGLLP